LKLKNEEYLARLRHRYATDPEYRAKLRVRGRAADKKRYATHRDEKLQRTTAYRLTHLDESRARIKRSAERYPETKTTWRLTHPDEIAEQQARRKARRHGASGSHILAEWQALKVAFDHRCAYCRKKSQELTRDHIIPLSKGGSDNIDNIVPACRSCNSRKWDKPLRKVSFKPVRLKLV